MPNSDAYFISPEELADIHENPDTSVVDGSWHLDPKKCARTEYKQNHLPGAVFFDLDEISDRTSDLPHMLPAPDQFATALGKLGVSNTHEIIIYDSVGLFSAPRVWWTFKAMGASKVRILEGGLPAWEAAGLPISSEPPKPDPVKFEATLRPDASVTLEGMRRLQLDPATKILDARPTDRFQGKAPEPRPGLRTGQMPGSLNLPSTDLIEDGRLIRTEKLMAKLQALALDKATPIVTTCGSGVTAAILSLALELTGHENVRLYDGSWAEWGSLEDTPVIGEGKN